MILAIDPEPPGVGLQESLLRFGGVWPSWYPYREFFIDINRVQVPLIAELYQVSTERVVSRSRVVMHDQRPDPDFTPAHGGTKINNALAMEVTAKGLDALERAHTRSLPQKSLAQFNGLLKKKFEGRRHSQTAETGFGTESRACVPIEDADPAFQNTAAYSSVRLAAIVDFLRYQALDELSSGGSLTSTMLSLLSGVIPGIGTLSTAALKAAANAAKQQYCVRTPVQASDFEVCSGRVDGVSRDLKLRSVNDTNLEIGTGIPFLAKVLLNRLDSEVDGYLRDISIRYRMSADTLCTRRPSSVISDTEMASTEGLNTWSYCAGLEADVTSANTLDWIPFSFDPDPGSPEKGRIAQGSAASPLYRLGDEKPVNADKGSCALDAFNPYVESLLDSYYSHLQSALDQAWKAGAPDTQQAFALDLLFSRWEPGVWADRQLRDHSLDLSYDRTGVLPAERVYALLDSEVKVSPRAELVPAPSAWPYAPPGGVPCLNPSSPACLPGKDYYGNEFDVSYSVTTGALNQVLKELSVTDWLRFKLNPTFADLGVTAPGNRPADQRPSLDGRLLAEFFAPFSEIGNAKVDIILQPTLLPFTWINPDPPPTPGGPVSEGRAPLTYQMSQYYVDFLTNKPGPDGTNLFLRVLADFYDPDFQLDLSENPGENLLTPAMSGKEAWRFTILKSQLSGCPISPMTTGLPAQPCGGDLVTKVGDLVRPYLQDKMAGMLSRYPAPIVYDAQGELAKPPSLTQLEKYQWDQVITLYADLP